jgi:hypothetical protein
LDLRRERMKALARRKLKESNIKSQMRGCSN